MITVLSLSPAVDKVYFLDGFEAGGLYRVKDLVKSAGGKGLNVARVASILGEQVRVLGFKAGDTGEWLEQQIKKLGISTNFISVEGESRTNNNIIDRLNQTETEVLEVGPFINVDKKSDFLNEFKDTLKSTGVLVCSGGLPEGISYDFYKNLIDIAKPYGVKIIMDTSNEVLEEGIKAKPYMIKPNLRELSKLVNLKLQSMDEIIKACQSVILKGVEVVVASMGKEGALLVSNDLILKGYAPEMDIINTIGSGDSLVAGLAAGFSRSYSLEAAFRLGMACSITNTQYKEIGFVENDIVERVAREIRIDRIE